MQSSILRSQASPKRVASSASYQVRSTPQCSPQRHLQRLCLLAQGAAHTNAAQERQATPLLLAAE